MKAIPLQTKDLFLLQEPFLEKQHSLLIPKLQKGHLLVYMN